MNRKKAPCHPICIVLALLFLIVLGLLGDVTNSRKHEQRWLCRRCRELPSGLKVVSTLR